MNYTPFLVALLVSCSFLMCKPTPTKESSIYTINQNKIADAAAVVSAHPLASKIGKDILMAGGNAVDAAIAVQFALAVVYPRAGNIGGGGFMTVRTSMGVFACLDYREKAPLKAHRDLYLDSLGNVIDGLSQDGHWAVGVPGTVDGMLKAFQRFTKLKDFKALVQPAIELAENGFQITESEANRLNKFKADFLKYNDASIPFIKDEAWKAGDLLVQKDLANTLKRIRDKGRHGFYAGETAQMILREMESSNGLISYEDLNNYKALWRRAVVTKYKSYKIISMPPPSSGGTALAQLLKIVEKYPIDEWGFHDPKTIHLMAEAERRVYADRAKHLGDMDFYPVPLDSLLDPTYIRNRMEDFDSQQASVSDSILAGNFKLDVESFETTHTSIIDAEGNAVSVTTTLNLNYGSKVLVDGAGFFLNNEMDDFSAKPGVPNYFGLVGAEANAIAPEKRMLSSMTPTIIEKEGKLYLVLGAPGGSTIITAIFQVFLNVAEFGMSLERAVDAGRFHHQWLPDEIMVEEGTFSDETKAALEAKGHTLNSRKKMAIVKAIKVLPNGKLHAVGDRRNSDDHVEGY